MKLWSNIVNFFFVLFTNSRKIVEFISFKDYKSGANHAFFSNRLKKYGIIGLILFFFHLIIIPILFIILNLTGIYKLNMIGLNLLLFMLPIICIFDFFFLEKITSEGIKSTKPLISLFCKLISFLAYYEYVAFIVVPVVILFFIATIFQKITKQINLKYIKKYYYLFSFQLWIIVLSTALCMSLKLQKNTGFNEREIILNEVQIINNEGLNKVIYNDENVNINEDIYNDKNVHMYEYTAKQYEKKNNHDTSKEIITLVVFYILSCLFINLSANIYFRCINSGKANKSETYYYDWYKYNSSDIVRLYDLFLLIAIIIVYILKPSGNLIVVLMVIQLIPDIKNKTMNMLAKRYNKEYLFDFLQKAEMVYNCNVQEINRENIINYLSCNDTDIYIHSNNLCYVDYISIKKVKDLEKDDNAYIEYVINEILNSTARSLLSLKFILFHTKFLELPYKEIKYNCVVVKRVQAFGIDLYIYLLESKDKEYYVFDERFEFDESIISEIYHDLNPSTEINSCYIFENDIFINGTKVQSLNLKPDLYVLLEKRYKSKLKDIKNYCMRRDSEVIEEIQKLFFDLYHLLPENIMIILYQNPRTVFSRLFRLINKNEFQDGSYDNEEFIYHFTKIEDDLLSIKSLIENMISDSKWDLQEKEFECLNKLKSLISDYSLDNYKSKIFTEYNKRLFTAYHLKKTKELLFK